MIYGETVNFALDKQIERLVEVLAASALLQVNNRDTEAFRKLREHAFPEKIDFDTDDPNVIFSKTYQQAIYCCGDDDCDGVNCEE